ncbi:MAG: hypothetical protein Q9N34_08795 [Aquificota bacterium]|nr:hypothetical protein [Aquificota bacterium]
MFGVLLLSLLLTSLSLPAPLKYCIQVATEKELASIKPHYEKVKNMPKARIEKRENLYLLRVGAEERRKDLLPIYRDVKKMFKDAYIKKCEIDKSYIVFPKEEEKTPEPEKVGSTEKEERKVYRIELTEIKELLISIKNDLGLIRIDIEKLKDKNRKENQKADTPVPNYIEKLIYSAGILLGGLFLFTWILIFLLYRKVGENNIKNTNLLNDVFNLIKVLSLLSKGNVIKMERGKILVYDEKNDKWKEVE